MTNQIEKEYTNVSIVLTLKNLKKDHFTKKAHENGSFED